MSTGKKSADSSEAAWSHCLAYFFGSFLAFPIGWRHCPDRHSFGKQRCQCFAGIHGAGSSANAAIPLRGPGVYPGDAVDKGWLLAFID
jgi:hypothetical protein